MHIYNMVLDVQHVEEKIKNTQKEVIIQIGIQTYLKTDGCANQMSITNGEKLYLKEMVIYVNVVLIQSTIV